MAQVKCLRKKDEQISLLAKKKKNSFHFLMKKLIKFYECFFLIFSLPTNRILDDQKKWKRKNGIQPKWNTENHVLFFSAI